MGIKKLGKIILPQSKKEMHFVKSTHADMQTQWDKYSIESFMFYLLLLLIHEKKNTPFISNEPLEKHVVL